MPVAVLERARSQLFQKLCLAANIIRHMLPLTLREANPELLWRAAELRRQMTPEERLVWQELRGNRLGVRFRRQQALAP
jgi:Protein of unknown function (DUF559)